MKAHLISFICLTFVLSLPSCAQSNLMANASLVSNNEDSFNSYRAWMSSLSAYKKCLFYYQNGDYVNAIYWRKKVYEETVLVYGEISKEAMYELYIIGCYYRDIKDYDSAITYVCKALDLSKICFAVDPLQKFGDLNYEGIISPLIFVFFADANRWEEAVNILKEYCLYLRNTYGNESNKYIYLLKNLSQKFYDLNQKNLYVSVEKELALYGSIGEIQYSLCNILMDDKNINLDSDAERYAERLYKTIKDGKYNSVVDEQTLRAQGYKSTSERDACEVLASYYNKIGSHERAFEMYWKLYMTEIKECEIKGNFLLYALMQANYNKNNADFVIKTCKGVLSKDLFDDIFLKQQIRDILRVAYQNKGFHKNAIEIASENLKENRTFGNYLSLSTSQLLTSDFAASYATMKEALNIGVVPKQEMPNVIKNLIFLSWHLGKYAEVDSMLPFFLDDFKTEISKFSLITGQERRQFIKQCGYISRQLTYWSAIIRQLENCEFECNTKCAYDYALLTKTILLSANAEFRKAIYATHNNEIIEQYKHLLSLRESSETERLQIEITEKEILNKLNESESFTHNLFCSWKDVQSQLKDDEVAIEFVWTIGIKNFNDKNPKPAYYALLLKKSYDAPHLVKCATDAEVDALLNEEDEIYNSKGVYVGVAYDLFWKQIEPYLTDVKTVYYAPIKDMYALAIESFADPTGKLASERWDIHRLSSTRELIHRERKAKIDEVVLYGGLVYQCSTDTIVQINKSYNYQADGQKLSIKRGIKFTPTRAMFTNLEYTLPEIRDIEKLLRNRFDVHYIEFVGAAGTEESFYSLSNKITNVLHIATHGFYYSKQDAEEKEDERDKYKFMLFDDGNDKADYEDKAMTRSGLLFSGAGTALRGLPLPDNMEDGILTAQELSNMNFEELDLVVLSACQSGLGYINSDSEGIFGLQRGFKLAGANSILMSLWEVPDRATSALMIEFYQDLIRGSSKTDALRQAQDKLRKSTSPDLCNPESWAGWILLDALN